MNTLNWNNHKQWFEYVVGIIRSLWGNDFYYKITKSKILSTFKELGGPYKIEDRHDWHSHRAYLNLINEIKNAYSHIRAYHACRPKNIDDYYSKGILPSFIKSLEENITSLLKECGASEEIAYVLRYMRKFYNESDEKVYVAVDKNHLETFCDHHLIYGSEYFLCAAALLGTLNNNINETIAAVSKQRSTFPVLFHCDIPIGSISNDALNEISGRLIIESLSMIVNPQYKPLSIRFGFGILDSIRPDWIVEHTFPILKNENISPPIWIDLDEFKRYSKRKTIKVEK
jgi:hypothetical protein